MSLEHETKSLGAKSDTGFAHRSTPFASARARRQLHKSVGDLRADDDDVMGASGGGMTSAKTKSVEQLHRMRAKLVDIDIGEKLKATASRQKQQPAQVEPLNAFRLRPIRQRTRTAVVQETKPIDLILKRRRASKIFYYYLEDEHFGIE